jgi:hypothetical protein
VVSSGGSELSLSGPRTLGVGVDIVVLDVGIGDRTTGHSILIGPIY